MQNKKKERFVSSEKKEQYPFQDGPTPELSPTFAKPLPVNADDCYQLRDFNGNAVTKPTTREKLLDFIKKLPGAGGVPSWTVHYDKKSLGAVTEFFKEELQESAEALKKSPTAKTGAAIDFSDHPMHIDISAPDKPKGF